MKRIITILFATLLIFGSCNNQQQTDKSTTGESTTKIVATTGIIKDALINIVKDKAEVAALMGPGVDPHAYKATQNDLNLLTNADLIFYNGLHLEGKMQEILEKLGKSKKVVAVADGIAAEKLRKVFGDDTQQGTHDPHIWFDIVIWTEVVQYINRTMQEVDASNADFYETNTQAYLNELSELQEKVAVQLAMIPDSQRVMVTSHDAFGYFGAAYNIEVKGLQGLSTVTEFGLKDVSNMVDMLTERKIKAVFVESAVPEKSLKAVVEGCQKRGHDLKIGGTLFADAMGEEGTSEGTYIGMMNYNVQTIVEALK